MIREIPKIPSRSKTFHERVVEAVGTKATAHTMNRWKLAADGIALARGEGIALELVASAPTVNILVFTAWKDLLSIFSSSSSIPEMYADVFKHGTQLRIRVILAKKPNFKAEDYAITNIVMRDAMNNFGVEIALGILKISDNFQELRSNIETVENSLQTPILAGVIYATSEKGLRSAIGKAVDAKTGFSDATEAKLMLFTALNSRTSE
ncbi:MAG: hypothetical protein Q7S22_06130, partial [Candidatus Micrarchaeota archaeon]|nr:hypothetical protein [Candidatus Micrarchaeota archaeon]